MAAPLPFYTGERMANSLCHVWRSSKANLYRPGHFFGFKAIGRGFYSINTE